MANTRLFRGKAQALKSRTPLYTADFAPVAAVRKGDRVFIGCCMLAILALAWGYLFYLDHQMMQSMEHGATSARMDMPDPSVTRAWHATDVFFTFVMWIVMMAGMMIPSVMPIVLLFAGAHARRGDTAVRMLTSMFVLGYVVVWTGFSALAALAQHALHQAGLLSPMMAASSSLLSGVTLCLAGAYQLTAQARLPGALPKSARFFHDALARWQPGCTADGDAPWSLLPGLLLGGDVGAIRCRCNESCLGRGLGAIGTD